MIPCSGSGKGAIFDFTNPNQKTEKRLGKSFPGMDSVYTDCPTNGLCVRCGEWFAITNRGVLVYHYLREIPNDPSLDQ